MNEDLLETYINSTKAKISDILTSANDNTPVWIKGVILSNFKQQQILDELDNLTAILLEEL